MPNLSALFYRSGRDPVAAAASVSLGTFRSGGVAQGGKKPGTFCKVPGACAAGRADHSVTIATSGRLRKIFCRWVTSAPGSQITFLSPVLPSTIMYSFHSS